MRRVVRAVTKVQTRNILMTKEAKSALQDFPMSDLLLVHQDKSYNFSQFMDLGFQMHGDMGPREQSSV